MPYPTGVIKTVGMGRRDVPNLPPYPANGDQKERDQWFQYLYDALREVIFRPPGSPGPAGTAGTAGATGQAGAVGTAGADGTIITVQPDLVIYGGRDAAGVATGGLEQDSPFFYERAIDRMTVPRVWLDPLVYDGAIDDGGRTRPLYPPLQFDPLANGTGALTYVPLSGAIEYDGTDFFGTMNTPTRRRFAWAGGSMPALGPFTANQILYGDDAGTGGIDQSSGLGYVALTNTMTVSGSPTASSVVSAIVNTSTATASVASLEMSGAGAVLVYLHADGLGTTILATPGGLLGPSTNHPLGIQTNNLERMRIAANGLVGIGTITGSARLTVVSSTEQATRFVYNSGATVTGVQLVSELIAQATADVTAALSYATMLRFSMVDVAGSVNPLAELRAYRDTGDTTGYFSIATASSGTLANALNITGAGVVNIPNLTASMLVGTDGSKNLVSTSAAAAGVVSGTGGANRVAYWTSATAITGTAEFTYDGTQIVIANAANSAGLRMDSGGGGNTAFIDFYASGVKKGNLFWNVTNARLALNDQNTTTTINEAGGSVGIGAGATTPSELVHISKSQNAATRLRIENGTSGTLAQAGINIVNSGGDIGAFSIYSATTTAYGALGVRQVAVYNNGLGIVIMADNASGVIKFATGGNATVASISAAGLVNIVGLTASQAVYTDASKNLTSTPPSGFGITGSGAAGQVAYWSGTSVLAGQTWDPGALYRGGAAGAAPVSVGTGTATYHLVSGGAGIGPSWTNALVVASANVSDLTANSPVYTDGSKNLTSTAPATGTFTPTVTLVGGAGNTVPVYTTNAGRYDRMGRIVFVSVYLSGDGGAEGAGTGVLTVAIPVTSSNSHKSGYQIAGYLQNNAARYPVYVVVSNASNVCTLYIQDAATTSREAIGTDQNDANRNISLDFWYEA